MISAAGCSGGWQVQQSAQTAFQLGLQSLQAFIVVQVLNEAVMPQGLSQSKVTCSRNWVIFGGTTGRPRVCAMPAS